MLSGKRDRSATLAYLAGREDILGERFQLSRDPRLAADMLVVELGSRAAGYAWVLEVLAVFEGDSPWQHDPPHRTDGDQDRGRPRA